MDGSQGYEPRVYYTPTMGYDAGSSGFYRGLVTFKIPTIRHIMIPLSAH